MNFEEQADISEELSSTALEQLIKIRDGEDVIWDNNNKIQQELMDAGKVDAFWVEKKNDWFLKAI